ncbi:MAG: zinc ribbon domain-containing protein [Eubacteriales bacterium]
MFCRKCGETLLDDDRFCPYCGAQVVERKKNGENKSDEDVVYNTNSKERHFFSESVKPNWNLDSFPNTEEEPKKTDDILVDWQQNILIEPTFKPEKDMSFSEQLQAFESSFDLSKKEKDSVDTEKKEQNTVQTSTIAKSTLIFERPKLEIEKHREDEMCADGVCRLEPLEQQPEKEEPQKEKFYTFSQKNAEFQKLLDKEYEKIKAGREETFNEIEELKKKDELSEFQKLKELVGEKEQEQQEEHEKPKEQEKQEEQDKREDSKEQKEQTQQEEKAQQEESEKPIEEKLVESIAEPEKAEYEEKIDMDWEQQAPPFEDEGKEKKISVAVAILSIVVLLLGLSIISLGVEQFAPDSAPGKAVHTYLEKARDFFRGDSA